MATSIKNPMLKPAEVFNMLHVDKLTFSQDRPKFEYMPIKRSVTIQGATYSIGENLEKSMSPQSLSATVQDLDLLLVDNYCQTKGKLLSEVPGDLAAAREYIITAYGTGEINDLHLMAAFELAIGRILELSGTIEIDKIE